MQYDALTNYYSTSSSNDPCQHANAEESRGRLPAVNPPGTGAEMRAARMPRHGHWPGPPTGHSHSYASHLAEQCGCRLPGRGAPLQEAQRRGGGAGRGGHRGNSPGYRLIGQLATHAKQAALPQPVAVRERGSGSVLARLGIPRPHVHGARSPRSDAAVSD